MHPVLIEVFGHKIYTYGPIMALGFLLGFLLTFHIIKKRNEDVEYYMDLYIFVIVIGILGAKVLYNVIEYEDFTKDPVAMLNPRNGGLVWYGGVVAVVAFIVWLTGTKRLPTFGLKKSFPFFFILPKSKREENISLFQLTDTLAPPLALGLAIGRFGCLCGGCCYGLECDLPWAITYPEGGGGPSHGHPVHPSPVYESLASFAIMVVTYVALMKKAKMGSATALWFTLYPIARFFLEFLRGDDVRGFFYESDLVNLSTSQAISILMLVGAGALWIYVAKSNPPPLVTYVEPTPDEIEDDAKTKKLKKKKSGKKGK